MSTLKASCIPQSTHVCNSQRPMTEYNSLNDPVDCSIAKLNFIFFRPGKDHCSTP